MPFTAATIDSMSHQPAAAAPSRPQRARRADEGRRLHEVRRIAGPAFHERHPRPEHERVADGVDHDPGQRDRREDARSDQAADGQVEPPFRPARGPEAQSPQALRHASADEAQATHAPIVAQEVVEDGCDEDGPGGEENGSVMGADAAKAGQSRSQDAGDRLASDKGTSA